MKPLKLIGLIGLTTTILFSAQSYAGGDDFEEKLSVEPVVDASSMIGMTPQERVATTPKGQLKNPYTGDEEMIKAGYDLFMGNSCNGCHGGTGGGGMCPPLSNEVFVYGSDDDTLFRLITLGSDQLAKAGYFRKGMEGVVGPMPPFGIGMDADSDPMITKDSDIWKIIAWIRTIYKGDMKRRDW